MTGANQRMLWLAMAVSGMLLAGCGALDHAASDVAVSEGEVEVTGPDAASVDMPIGGSSLMVGDIDSAFRNSGVAVEVEITGMGPVLMETEDGLPPAPGTVFGPTRSITATVVGAHRGLSEGVEAVLTFQVVEVIRELGSGVILDYQGIREFGDIEIGDRGLLLAIETLDQEWYDSGGEYNIENRWYRLERLLALQAASGESTLDIVDPMIWFVYDEVSGTAYSPMDDVTMPISKALQRAGL